MKLKKAPRMKWRFIAVSKLGATVSKLDHIKDMLETERAIASDSNNELLTMIFDDAIKSLEHGGVYDAVFDLCGSIKLLDRINHLKKSDKPD